MALAWGLVRLGHPLKACWGQGPAFRTGASCWLWALAPAGTGFTTARPECPQHTGAAPLEQAAQEGREPQCSLPPGLRGHLAHSVTRHPRTGQPDLPWNEMAEGRDPGWEGGGAILGMGSLSRRSLASYTLHLVNISGTSVGAGPPLPSL